MPRLCPPRETVIASPVANLIRRTRRHWHSVCARARANKRIGMRSCRRVAVQQRHRCCQRMWVTISMANRAVMKNRGLSSIASVMKRTFARQALCVRLW